MPTASPRFSTNVRPSTDEDLSKLLYWLEYQHAENVEGSFWCNRNQTEDAHKDRRLLVHLHHQTDEVLGYQWGGLIRPGILEVRADMRGRGIGRELVEHSLALAADAGQDILCIQCTPDSAWPFWMAMGFRPIPDSEQHGPNAYRVMPRPRPIEAIGVKRTVLVEWYHEHAKYNGGAPFAAVEVTGYESNSGFLNLTERVACPTCLTNRDLVARVLVDGEQLYFHKAKYQVAIELGIDECRNGYFIDTLMRPKIGARSRS